MIDDPHAYQHREGDAHQWLCRFGIDNRHCVTGTTTKTAITVRGGDETGVAESRSGSLVSLSWNTTDPYAITMLVHDDESGEADTWVFARELLIEGGGIGDVRVRHGLVTSLELDSPEKDITLRLSVTWVEHFLRYTEDVMPLGREPSLVDVTELEWTTELEWLADGRADI
ncbi:SsgA family sporulation/cell division regulator [Umezawaea sp. Da 62-37]|uniref:SsgA family sporulation/cell division regulator n=1 Tax=Umezawaea sp. Da 62-37 TaxID=3075927 RepID=UPI0028F6FCAF|nr:SsgA family sporulation/cell division regulator [Umezawaea sp. Da 62-37]WNV83975.1 SsgA family sporulation/cell division regulator [Umezawaea sp. Da 62-37]